MSKTKNLDKTIIVTGNKLAIVGDAERRVRSVQFSPTVIGPNPVDRGEFPQTTGPIDNVLPDSESNE